MRFFSMRSLRDRVWTMMRQLHDDRRALLTPMANRANGASVRVNDALDDIQPEPESTVPSCGPASRVLLEHVFGDLGRQTETVISDREHRHVAAGRHLHVDGLALAESERIVEQVAHDRSQARCIPITGDRTVGV
jgi:hypothetical protein